MTIHSFSLSTGHAEPSCSSKGSNTAGRACTISMSSRGLVWGWCCAQVLPPCLTPAGSVPVPGLTGSAAAAAHSHCCAHLWWADHKIPIATGPGSNISFSKTWVLATVLNFHVEYPLCVCVHFVSCSICLEVLKQNVFVSFIFLYLTTADAILVLFVNGSLFAAKSQKKARHNKYSSKSTQKVVDHWNDNQRGSLYNQW